jgi:hypothetical protein
LRYKNQATACGTLLLTLIALGAPAANTPKITFLGRTYHLASFNQKGNPMWEFTTGNETVNNWTTLLTIIDRPDATTRTELNRLSQGILDHYKSNGAKILVAKNITDAPFNYLAAAFDQPAEHRFELNFVKVALGPKNAYMVLYGVRVADRYDYVVKSRSFLNDHSDEIEREVERATLPPTSTLPRKEF